MFTYNAAGQAISMTTAAGTMQLGYQVGDLTSITDPIGRTMSRFVDAAGRVVRVTNPLGQATTYTYDALNDVTKVTDALGGETTFTYDPNANLLTLTDALNHTTTYTYNNMDRVATRTDPLNRQESYAYDLNGNLQQFTDRKGQVTGYAYDGLDRLHSVTYADTSTTTYAYDAGNRLLQVADSVGGTIGRSYDGLNRLTQETTPEGAISYTYDTADRRVTMTVAGQTAVNYAYDAANRLTSITQGAAAVGFGYDAANRRTMLTLPNGIQAGYSYDPASELTDLTYTLGGTTIGELTYAYDEAGRRTAVGGSWGRTGLPNALSSATYDAANEIATWEGNSFSHDANGNLLNDGVLSYTWNARNQLSALAGTASASFGYDGVGRRRVKGTSSGTTTVLFDGPNAVQELVAGSPSANALTTLSVDENLIRVDGAGTSTLLSDGLGSTLEVTDAAGALQTHYTYGPFGSSSTAGAPSGNASEFTGREDDRTGLYFYRARYYNPSLQRFVSEDNLRFSGDMNLYRYAADDPVNATDPSGHIPLVLPIMAIGAIAGGVNEGTAALANGSTVPTIAASIGEGVVAGAASAAAATFVEPAVGPAVAGAVASATYDFVMDVFGGHFDTSGMIADAMVGAGTGYAAHAMTSMPGRNPNPWSSRPVSEYGPKSMNAIRQSGLEGALNWLLSPFANLVGGNSANSGGAGAPGGTGAGGLLGGPGAHMGPPGATGGRK